MTKKEIFFAKCPRGYNRMPGTEIEQIFAYFLSGTSAGRVSRQTNNAILIYTRMSNMNVD